METVSVKSNKTGILKKDEELLHLLENDSIEAYEELYIRYKKRLKQFCTFILKSESQSEDIVQEIFMKIWLRRKQLNTGQSFSFLIYTMAKNQSLNELRSTKRNKPVECPADVIKEEKNVTETAEETLIFTEYTNLLKEAISQLPVHKREIYTMSREEKLSHKEIAKKLSLSPHTVQSHISDSLLFIKKYFVKHADVELYSIFIILFC